MKHFIIVLLSMIALTSTIKAQTDTLKIEMPTKAKLYKKIKHEVEVNRDDFYHLFRKDSLKFKAYSVEFMLDRIDNDSNYHYLFIAEYWMAFNYYEMLPALIERITHDYEVGLINTGDLIIEERIASGDLTYYGHGGVAFDDLFKVSGRANHLLKRITGKDFGSIGMTTEMAELKAIQKKWLKWLRRI